ncbi:carboxylating nicotinate-nucleotide diphosphorylase [Chryseobacterium sp. A301]
MTRPPYATDKVLNQFIKSALEEDLGNGDHSTLSTIPKDLIQKAQCIIKEDCILAGVELAEKIFTTFDKTMEIEVLIKDGTFVKKGAIAFIVSGKAQSILQTERLVLNCMQRMSGIATLTHDWDSRLLGTKTKLLDTRKTTPNFRVCEKWAVAIGGGTNHRYGLYDMIMLKDNHIDFNGSITDAVKRCKEYLKTNKKRLKIEVETRNLAEVKEAIDAKVDRIMLDNMDNNTMSKAVELIAGRCESEASGGITRDRLQSVAACGVDFISAGAITHSASNIDISLKAVPNDI